MASKLEELLKKLEAKEAEKKAEEASAEQKKEMEKTAAEAAMEKLSEEEAAALEKLGEAYLAGYTVGLLNTLAAMGLLKTAEEDPGAEAQLVDADGDGAVDHIELDAEEAVELINDMLENGEISEEEAVALVNYVAEQLEADEQQEEQKEEQEKEAGALDWLKRRLAKPKGALPPINPGAAPAVGGKPTVKVSGRKNVVHKKVLLPIGIGGLAGGGIIGYNVGRRQSQ